VSHQLAQLEVIPNRSDSASSHGCLKPRRTPRSADNAWRVDGQAARRYHRCLLANRGLSEAAVLTVALGGANDGYVDASTIDNAWGEAVGSAQSRDPAAVCLDLSAAHYVEHACLLMLTAIVARRHERGLETRLKLPRKKSTLDFLRTWKLLEALAVVTDLDNDDLLAEGEVEFLAQQSEESPRYVRVTDAGPTGREELLPVGFFWLTPVVITDPAVAAHTMRERWLNDHVLSVLDRYLDGDASRIATNVVYEAVLNAGQHPRATIAFTCSQINERPRPSALPVKTGERELVVSIWDDGQSYAETLTEALDEHGTYASPAWGMGEDTFRVSSKDLRTGKAWNGEIRSSGPLPPVESESLLTLAAFMLGITRDPFKASDETIYTLEGLSQFLPSESVGFSGLGLHIIRKTAVDLFRGSLTYMSGRLRLEIANDDSSAGAYRVAALRRRDTEADVKGNLLVVRMRISGD